MSESLSVFKMCRNSNLMVLFAMLLFIVALPNFFIKLITFALLGLVLNPSNILYSVAEHKWAKSVLPPKVCPIRSYRVPNWQTIIYADKVNIQHNGLLQ